MECKYLGWANGWTETPEIVKNCKHKLIATPGKWSCDTEYRCPICGYYYDVDSSD